MKYCLVLVQWMVLVTAMAAPAKAPKPGPIGNRFLFILETSAAMSRFEHGGRQAIFDLIYSSVDGRMRKGDTYGLWTFNQNVYAGFYPMQIWDGQTPLDHATAAGRFLKSQKYETIADLSNVVTQLQAVVRVAKDLNVFIVTTDNVVVSGTPFDAEINSAYRTNALEVRRTGKPLITTFAVRNGQLSAAAVTLAGEPIALAALPPQTNRVVELTATLAARATNQTAPQKPLGQIISLADVTGTPQTEEPANFTTATTPTVVTNSINTSLRRGGGTTFVAPTVLSASPTPPSLAAANAVEAGPVFVMPPVFVTPFVSETPSNLTSTVTATSSPPPVVSAPTVATNEPAPRPQPLPAIIPAQIEVSATTSDQTPKLRETWPGGKVMLILGGAFVGVSLLAAVVFFRRIRAARQPSFISLGMDRR